MLTLNNVWRKKQWIMNYYHIFIDCDISYDNCAEHFVRFSQQSLFVQ